jgi:hypothetical protein
MSFQRTDDRKITLAGWVWLPQHHTSQSSKPVQTSSPNSPQPRKIDVLAPLRKNLDQLQVQNVRFAHFVCKLIPPQCPFERDVKLFGKLLFHIPPMCKLNPLYEEVVALRFRALCYLADECGEDISTYC